MSFNHAWIQRHEKVYFYFLKKTKSEEDAKDLLQTTFLKLWQYRTSLSEKYNLDQHLFSIARTVFIDYLRSQSKLAKVAATADDSAEEPSQLPGVEEQQSLQQALARMPATRKNVFVLHRLHGYSYKEVAEQLSISVKAVDNHLAKALKQLKKFFLFTLICLLLVS